MKTTMIMRKIFVLVMMTLLPALFGAAQVGAVDYKSTYKSPYNYRMQTQSPAPTVEFQSTSVLPASGSAYMATPMIGDNGAAQAPSYAAPGRIGHIRRDGIDDDDEEGEGTGNAGTPGQTVDQKDQLPLGDVVWPLMMLLCAYAGYKKVRARKEG